MRSYALIYPPDPVTHIAQLASSCVFHQRDRADLHAEDLARHRKARGEDARRPLVAQVTKTPLVLWLEELRGNWLAVGVDLPAFPSFVREHAERTLRAAAERAAVNLGASAKVPPPSA